MYGAVMRQRRRERESNRPSFQPNSYTIPKLSLKAKERLNHYGFREPGHKSVEDRIKKLSAKISSLGEIEERLRAEKENLSSLAQKDATDAKTTRSSLRGDLNKMDFSLQALGRGVLKQFDETRSELTQKLERLEELERIPKETGFLGGTNNDHDDREKKFRLQKGRLTERLKGLNAELEILKEKGPRRYPWWENSRYSSESDESEQSDVESMHSDTKITRKSGVSGVSSRSTTKTGNRSTGKRDMAEHQDNEPQKALPVEQAAQSDVKEHQETETQKPIPVEETAQSDAKEHLDLESQKSPSAQQTAQSDAQDERADEPGPDDVSSDLQRQEVEGNDEGFPENYNSGSEDDYLREDIAIRTKKYEIRQCELRILSLADRLKNYHEMRQKKAERSREAEDLLSEDEQEREGGHKTTLRERDDQELEEFNAQGHRDKALRKLHKKVLRLRFQQREQISAGRAHWTDREHLLYDDINFRYRVRGSRFPYGSDTETGETDDEDDEDKKNVHDFLELLDKLISDALTLETHIQKILRIGSKFDDLVHLKGVLDMERKLERHWLEDISPLHQLESSTTGHGHHFDGSPVPKTIYEELGNLERGDLRVLVLIPAPEPYYPLICTLERWSPDSQRGKSYAALSYFWGSEACNGRVYLISRDDVPILKDADAWGVAARKATQIRIRNNLFRALLRLRRHSPDTEKVALWVDFMCINQNNPKEKTDQLGRMVNIYRNARNVCIWLGESDVDGRSDKAMDFISAIMDFAILEQHARDPGQAAMWYALGELMRDRWFSRRWVVQEIALAQDATVHCGARIVRWSDFADAASVLVSNQEAIKSLFDFSKWREGRLTLGNVDSFGASILLEATNKLFRRRLGGEIKRPIKKIESLVTSLKTFDTGDPRDLVYSVVGIASDTSNDLWEPDPYAKPNPRLKLEVNYEKSQVDVYKDFTKFCVGSSKSLDIICRPWAMPLKDKSGNITHVPSWIPLLSKSEFGLPEEVYSGRKNGEGLVGPVGSPNYRASGKTRCCARFEASDPIPTRDWPRVGSRRRRLSMTSDKRGLPGFLYATGFRLAEIRKVSARNTGGVVLRESLEMGGWQGFKQNPDKVPDEIWRTLVADRDHDGQVPPSWYQRACLRCLEIADTFNNGDLNIGELLQGPSEMLRKYLTRVRNVTWNRRFFSAQAVTDSHSIREANERTRQEKYTPKEWHRSKPASTANSINVEPVDLERAQMTERPTDNDGYEDTKDTVEVDRKSVV